MGDGVEGVGDSAVGVPADVGDCVEGGMGVGDGEAGTTGFSVTFDSGVHVVEPRRV